MLPPTAILICKSECRFINLQLEKNLAWDCGLAQKNAWQFRRFLSEYRIRTGCPQGTVLSSLGSLMNCLSCPKRCFCLKSQNISSLSTLMPEWSWGETDPASLLSSLMTTVTCLSCWIVLPFLSKHLFVTVHTRQVYRSLLINYSLSWLPPSDI